MRQIVAKKLRQQADKIYMALPEQKSKKVGIAKTGMRKDGGVMKNFILGVTHQWEKDSFRRIYRNLKKQYRLKAA